MTPVLPTLKVLQCQNSLCWDICSQIQKKKSTFSLSKQNSFIRFCFSFLCFPYTFFFFFFLFFFLIFFLRLTSQSSRNLRHLNPSVLFPIACKFYPVMCIWLTLSHKISSLDLNTPLCIPVLNHRLKKNAFNVQFDIAWLQLPAIGSYYSFLFLIKKLGMLPHENTCPYNQVPSQSSFWWAKQIKFSKPHTKGNFLHFSNQFCGYFLDLSVLQPFLNCYHQNWPQFFMLSDDNHTYKCWSYVKTSFSLSIPLGSNPPCLACYVPSPSFQDDSSDIYTPQHVH